MTIPLQTALRLALFASLALSAPTVFAAPWQPPADYRQVALWPDKLPIAKPAVTGEETVTISTQLLAGHTVATVDNVTLPTMAILSPKTGNTGIAMVVFPGGGYKSLAIDLEGTEVCDWLNHKGITCVVLKYRVPGSGPQWNDACSCHKIPKVPMALQDAQRAIVLLRQHAADYGIDPHKIGVLGFSAGGHMVASISTHERAYATVDAADALNPRPDFAIALYPGHLWAEPGLELSPDIRPDARTPPTFIVQAEDDPVDDVRNSLVYYVALKKAKVPTEMHLYAHGGHAFGLRPANSPILAWPGLVETWLDSIGMTKTR